jgi:hypothetical protein
MRIVLTNKPEESEEDAAAARNPHENNQKLGLLAALLRAGAWRLADLIMTRLPRAYCVSQVWGPLAALYCNPPRDKCFPRYSIIFRYLFI